MFRSENRSEIPVFLLNWYSVNKLVSLFLQKNNILIYYLLQSLFFGRNLKYKVQWQQIWNDYQSHQQYYQPQQPSFVAFIKQLDNLKIWVHCCQKQAKLTSQFVYTFFINLSTVRDFESWKILLQFRYIDVFFALQHCSENCKPIFIIILFFLTTNFLFLFQTFIRNRSITKQAETIRSQTRFFFLLSRLQWRLKSERSLVETLITTRSKASSIACLLDSNACLLCGQPVKYKCFQCEWFYCLRGVRLETGWLIRCSHCHAQIGT